MFMGRLAVKSKLEFRGGPGSRDLRSCPKPQTLNPSVRSSDFSTFPAPQSLGPKWRSKGVICLISRYPVPFGGPMATPRSEDLQ